MKIECTYPADAAGLGLARRTPISALGSPIFSVKYTDRDYLSISLYPLVVTVLEVEGVSNSEMILEN